MPVQSVICDQEKIIVCTAEGKCAEVPYSALSGTRLEKEATLITMLQGLLDDTIRLTRLPQGDPDKDTDPGLPTLFWSEDGKFLVSRAVKVLAAPWSEDGARFVVQLVYPGSLPGGGG